MKKIASFLLALILIGGGVSFAMNQRDAGEDMSSSKGSFFVGRYGRTAAIATNGNMISKDTVVVWDSTSNDGVTVNHTTTSGDLLNAGIAMDNIPGSSRDTTAPNDLAGGNWGRIQTWGRHASVLKTTNTALPIGTNVCTSATSGIVQTCSGAAQSVDNAAVGVTLQAATASSTTVDINITGK